MTAQRFAIATLIALSATAAMAADNTPLTRAAVVAEFQAARTSGQLLGAGEALQDRPVAIAAGLSRAQVEAAVVAAQQSHELVAAGELSPPQSAPQGFGRSRAEVKAETRAAVAAGTLLGAGEALSADHAISSRAPVRRSVAGL